MAARNRRDQRRDPDGRGAGQSRRPRRRRRHRRLLHPARRYFAGAGAVREEKERRGRAHRSNHPGRAGAGVLRQGVNRPPVPSELFSSDFAPAKAEPRPINSFAFLARSRALLAASVPIFLKTNKETPMNRSITLGPAMLAGGAIGATAVSALQAQGPAPTPSSTSAPSPTPTSSRASSPRPARRCRKPAATTSPAPTRSPTSTVFLRLGLSSSPSTAWRKRKPGTNRHPSKRSIAFANNRRPRVRSSSRAWPTSSLYCVHDESPARLRLAGLFLLHSARPNH